ncbi:MAG: ATP-dependent RNA helicase HrpA [Actinomycetota bacterium]
MTSPAATLRASTLDDIRASGKLVTPDTLPIAQWREELLTAIRDHQVVVVAGETGSGKSTQLPKLCLELGRGIDGLIGHTQPRRVAARTIAERIADELGTGLGAAVGYTVRFTDKVRDTTLIKVMTDGILLAEIQRDRMLGRYDTIIIDEAHERSLNIDFLLGYLRQLLPKRPDLKVVVTSATIDTVRFSEHFGGAPIVEVEGRTYPVEVRFRPFGEDPGDDRDQVQAVCDAVDELERDGPGDVLVFLSGEREIHDVADTLRRREPSSRHPLQVLPLYARLSSVEQHRIFEPHTGRRVVLSTNVAETSLTVPGVRFVVDAGSARISRYSHRLKVQRLPIEPVSQASANQRSGRCGRVAPGICIRLYSETEFERRPEFTEPEILRTNLASVILQMTALGLGDVAAFPFLDPPDSRSIRDGYALLEELGAIEIAGVRPGSEGARRLTSIGTRLARLPIDPRLGRMVLEADRHGCVREVMVIAAALSIQDPRERPAESRQAADESHRRFTVEGSDLLSLVKLWDHLRERQLELSGNQFRKLCRAEFLNYLRVREWQDLYSQLRQITGSLGIHQSSSRDTSRDTSRGAGHGVTAGHPDRVHQAVLSGMLSHLGARDGTARDSRGEYRGAHGAKFKIAPGSALSSKGPAWLIAAELVETNRLWGRMAAAVQPEWAERIGSHLVKRSYGEPRWDARRGAAVTTERVSLYGLPIVAGRTIGYDRVDGREARAMFIRHALVDGDWTTHHRFDAANREFLASIRSIEGRLRRSDLTDDGAVFGFFDRRVGADVVSMRHFDQWWKLEGPKHPDLLDLTVEVLAGETLGSDAVGLHDFPTTWRHDDLDLAVSYHFDPGDAHDGVTVHLPLAVLNRVSDRGFDWQVTGLRGELVEALIRTLPKAYRREMVPLAEFVSATKQRLSVTDEPFVEAVARALTDVSGVIVPPDLLDVARVPAHLRISFAVEDEHGRRVAVDKHLGALRRRLSGHVRAAIAAAAPIDERSGIVTWDLGAMPRLVETVRNGVAVKGFPALVDDGDSVSVRVLTNTDLQARVMRAGVRRLMLLAVAVSRRAAERDLTTSLRLSIARSGLVSLDDLIADSTSAAADAVMASHDQPVWNEDEFASLVRHAREELADVTARSVAIAAAVLGGSADLRASLDRLVTPAVQPSVDDMRAQIRRLVRPGFVTATGAGRLPDVLRYLKGIEHRIDKLPEDPRRDQQRLRDVHALEARYSAFIGRLDRGQVTPAVIDLGWMLEELRIGVFAQTVGTSRPVSVQRVAKELARLGG